MLRQTFSCAVLTLFLPAVFVAGLFTITGTQAAEVQTQTIHVSPPATEVTPDVPATEQASPEGKTSTSSTAATAEEEVLPEVHYGEAGLPKPVARMRSQLMDAASRGDYDRLRMVLESNEMPPVLSLQPIDDPIEFLKQSSADPDGLEILAILMDTLDAGWVHVDQGTPQEMYIWPYFARYPFEKLTTEQKVEMFRIITGGDFASMQSLDAWLFYRVGIGPDGTLHYFVAGD